MNQSSSVTRWWNKKLSNIFQYCPKSSQIIFTLKLSYFKQPKNYQDFWATFVRKFVTKKINNRPIWTHCNRETWHHKWTAIDDVVCYWRRHFFPFSFSSASPDAKNECPAAVLFWNVGLYSSSSKSKKYFFSSKLSVCQSLGVSLSLSLWYSWLVQQSIIFCVASVTRSGEILPLWRNFRSLWLFFGGAI